MRLEILSNDSQFVSRCRSVLTVWGDTMCVDTEIAAHNSRDVLPEGAQPGILFADVDSLQGLQELKSLDNVRCEHGAMFVCSADPRKAIECYQLRPAGFLPKPLTAAAVERNMNRCVALWQSSLKWLELMENRSRINVPVCEILWVETIGRGCTVHTMRREIQVGESITRLAELLPEELFVRCQRSFLVNLHFVRDVDSKYFYMTDGAPVPIGRGNRTGAAGALERHRALWNWDGQET